MISVLTAKASMAQTLAMLQAMYNEYAKAPRIANRTYNALKKDFLTALSTVSMVKPFRQFFQDDPITLHRVRAAYYKPLTDEQRAMFALSDDAQNQGGVLPSGFPKQSEVFRHAALCVTEDDLDGSVLNEELCDFIEEIQMIVQRPRKPEVLYVRLMMTFGTRDERKHGTMGVASPFAYRAYASSKAKRASDDKGSSSLVARIVKDPHRPVGRVEWVVGGFGPNYKPLAA